MMTTNKNPRSRSAFTLVEMILAIGIVSLLGLAVTGVIYTTYQNWEFISRRSNVIMDGQASMEQMMRILRQAKAITAVSESTDTDGYITYTSVDDITEEFRLNTSTDDLEFGEPGSLSPLVGPVTSVVFTSYDATQTALTGAVAVADIREVHIAATFADADDNSVTTTLTGRIYIPTVDGECLVGHWKLDETSGTTASDSSGNGNDGTLTSMVGDEWTTGVVGGALDFTPGDYILDADGENYINGLTAFTVSVWIKSDVINTDNGFLIGQDPASSSGAFAMRYDAAGGDGGGNNVIKCGHGSGTLESSSNVQTTSWQHLALTWSSGNQLALYIDGSLDTPTAYDPAFSGSISGQDRLIIGRGIKDKTGGEGWNGIIDDVRIYNCVLDPCDIAALADPVRYREFTEAKAATDTTSLTIATPGVGGGSGTVSILGSWTSGTTHSAEAGSNRLLVFTGHGRDDDSGTLSVDSVTYGGQSMTKVIERQVTESNLRTYVVAYILDEAGIAAASSSTFSPSWSGSPDQVGYSSVFLNDADQADPIGASDGATSTANGTGSLATGALSNSNGDLVILAASDGRDSGGNFTCNNGFTEALEPTMVENYGDAVAGYKAATGSDETPSVSHSNSARKALIGFVVQAAAPVVTTIEGDLLIAAVATDGDTDSTLAPPGGENWTEIDLTAYSSYTTLGAWWKNAEASESATHQFTWTGDQQAYGWMMRFTGHDPTTPINDLAGNGGSSSAPTSPAITTTVEDTLILRMGAFNEDDITEDAPGLLGHTAITMDKSSEDMSNAGLVGWWKMDEASGTTAADSSGNGNNGTLTNMAGNEWTTGEIDGALEFNPSNDIVIVNQHASINNLETFTLTTWVYVNSLRDYGRFFQKLPGFIFCLGATADKNMVLTAERWGNRGFWRTNNGTIQAGQWYHVAASYDYSSTANNPVLYINGVSVNVNEFLTPSGSRASDTSDLYLGNQGAPWGQYLDGYLDDMRIYDRVLSGAEIAILAAGGGATSGSVSGGAGYELQGPADSSGTSDFTLTATQESRTITVGIAPAP